MTRFHIPLVARRWRFIAAVAGVTALAGGGVLLAAAPDDATALAFHTVPTLRVLDTRAISQVGPRNTPLGLAGTVNLVIPGLPTDATGVTLNVTAVDGTEGSFLTVYPEGDVRPLTSTVNWDAAGAVANSATVDLHDDQAITIYNLKGTVNVVVDLLGYYAPSPAGGGAKGDTGAPGVPAPAVFFSATNNAFDLLPPLASLQFNTPGPASGITSGVPVSVFTVAAAGTYKLTFAVQADSDNQFTVVVNDDSVPTGLTFGALGSVTNEGSAVLALAAGDTVSVQNTTGADVQLSGPTGGPDPSINATIVIERL